MTHKKLAVYSFILAVLFLMLTFSVVKRNARFSAENTSETFSTEPGDFFFTSPDTNFSEIQIEKITPIFAGVSPDFDQEWGRNPFQPFFYSRPIHKKRLRQRALQLEGIIQKGGLRKVIINGKILTIGDKIENYRVKLILENMVALTNGNREIYLKF
ncbi:MAG: hypothetical protein GXO76_14605 [Calditrichaeota bacterium]|nr:hypothetical protein [Calditrichota bacterium]